MVVIEMSCLKRAYLGRGVRSRAFLSLSRAWSVRKRSVVVNGLLAVPGVELSSAETLWTKLNIVNLISN